MNTDLSVALNAHVSALLAGLPASEFESAADAAQGKLDARLSTRKPTLRRPWIGWIAAAATACVVLALALLPVSSGVAFATVQKHLSDFDTLTLVIDQQSQGMALPGIQVRMNRDGDVRTDVGEVSSTVVSVRHHTLLTLLHDTHQAMLMPIPATATYRQGDNLAWLDAIRHFQGTAQRLPGGKLIDGCKTTGWSLESQGMHIVLWADDDGLPRAIEINGGMYRQQMHVTVDAPINAAVFSTSLPNGYHLMGSDND